MRHYLELGDFDPAVDDRKRYKNSSSVLFYRGQKQAVTVAVK